ncbi:hypothetical protein L211DRAFT_659792 [Terfezia boudieri ATCC MYA-4762]|uniref:Uncharacterized protein n=1 Tax=Terfezia boudieri ATCC MYA-4762 TaxID=1051890 RepID=A0A3N4LVQ5_9PEZI|nr:hypothetical protein L211DRAFT_659792 [Terfezia boudieri ATCC MYA-4762]
MYSKLKYYNEVHPLCFMLNLSLFVYYVWWAPPRHRRVLQPISVSYTNILQHLRYLVLESRSLYATSKRKTAKSKTQLLKREKDLIHHRLPKDSDEDDEIECRCHTQAEASQWFKIPQTTIAEWWKIQVHIVGQKIGSRRQTNTSWLCLWHSWRLPYLSVWLKECEAGRPGTTSPFQPAGMFLVHLNTPGSLKIMYLVHTITSSTAPP